MGFGKLQEFKEYTKVCEGLDRHTVERRLTSSPCERRTSAGSATDTATRRDLSAVYLLSI